MMLQTVNEKTMLSDNSYAFGKKAVQVYLPAASALYFGLGNIWGFPAVEQVVGTFAVIATFLGVCLGLSSAQFDKSGAAFDGDVVVTTKDSGAKHYSLNLNYDPSTLDEKEALKFRVVPGD